MVTIIIVLDLQNTAYYKKMQYNNEETIHRVVGILNFGARLWVLISAPPLTGRGLWANCFQRCAGGNESYHCLTLTVSGYLPFSNSSIRFLYHLLLCSVLHPPKPCHSFNYIVIPINIYLHQTVSSKKVGSLFS